MPYQLGEPTVQQYFDENGDPLENGTIEFYLSGTSTPTPVYQSAAGVSAGTSVSLSSIGAPLNGSSVAIALYFDTSIAYKIVRKTAAGAEIAPTIDPYYVNGSGIFSVDAIDSGASSTLYDYVGAFYGQQASVSGYYAAGDCDTRVYVWTNTSDADDAGAVILPTGHVGAGRWVLQIGTHVDPRWWGAKGDDSTDDATAWQSCATYAAAQGVEIRPSPGNYALGTTVEIPYNVSVIGTGANDVIISSRTGGTYYDTTGTLVAGASGGFLFFLNIDPASPATWVQQFPNMTSGRIEGLKIDGEATTGVNGFYFGGSHVFRRIQCSYIVTLIEKPSVYADHVVIEDIHHDSSTRINTTDYLVYLRGLGDGLYVRNVVAGKTSGSSEGKGLYVGSCKGGRVENLINGFHTFENTGPGFTVSNAHIEGGGFELDSSGATIRDNWFYVTSDNYAIAPSITINNDLGATTQSRSMPTIRDNRFIYVPNFGSGWPATDPVDIDTGGFPCLIENNFRQITVSGNVSRSQVMGCTVGNGATIYDDWKNYAHILCQRSVVVNSGYVPISGTVNVLKTFTGWTSGTLATTDFSSQSWTFGGANATYYYSIQLLSDPVRLIGKNASTAETSGALTNGGNIASPQIAQGILDTRSGYVYRVYRGTSTGSYDNYVDIPAFGLVTLYDDGDACNGFNWISRSAGAVDTLNNTSIEGPINYTEGVAELRMVSTTIPTVGTWQSGDIIHRDTFGAVPSVGATSLAQVTRITTGSGHVDGTDWIKWVFERG